MQRPLDTLLQLESGLPASHYLRVLDDMIDDPDTRSVAFDLVAEHSGCSVNALHCARRRAGESTPATTKFSELTEKVVAGFLMARSLMKRPASVDVLKGFVDRLTGQSVSTSWVHAFIKRHRALLKLATPRAESTKRHAHQLVQDAEHFADSFTRWQTVVPVTPATLLNADEKRVAFGGQAGLRVLCKTEFNSNLDMPRGQSLCTLLPFVKADGTCVALFYFFSDATRSKPAKRVVWVPSRPRRARQEPERYVMLTPTSYLQGEHYMFACLEVAEIMRRECPGRAVTLLHDSVRIHTQLPTLELCMERHLLMHSLVVNGTSFCQPLDVRSFGVWESAMASRASQIDWTVVSAKERLPVMMALAYAVEPIAFAPSVTRAGFAAAYIWPWRPNELVERARAEAGRHVPHLVDELVERSAQAMVEQLVQARACVDGLLASVAKVKPHASPKPKSTYELVAELSEQAAGKAAEAENKIKRDAERKRARKERAETESRRKAHREQNRCAAEDCSSAHFKSKIWACCGACGKKFCPKHRSNVNTHNCSKKPRRSTRKRRT